MFFCFVFYCFMLHHRILNLCDSRLRLWSRLSKAADELEGKWSIFPSCQCGNGSVGNSRLGTASPTWLSSGKARKPTQQTSTQGKISPCFSGVHVLPDSNYYRWNKKEKIFFFPTKPDHGDTFPVAHSTGHVSPALFHSFSCWIHILAAPAGHFQQGSSFSVQNWP